MSTLNDEYSQRIKIDSYRVDVLTFTADGQHIISGGNGCVQVSHVMDGRRVATMQVKNDVSSVAASKDGRYIAGGSRRGEVLVWDAMTYEQVFAEKIGRWAIWNVDFSPKSSRFFASANGGNRTATVWDIRVTRKKVHILDHKGPVKGATYSLRGDRIATADKYTVRVWSNDGNLLVDLFIGVEVRRGLLWFNNHLFVSTTEDKIKQIDGSTGLTVSEWSVPGSKPFLSLSPHGKFLAYSTAENITFWDTLTHSQVGLIPRRGTAYSIAFSPCDQLLAIVVHERNIILKDLSFIQEPYIHIGRTALDAWKHAQLARAETLLTAAISTSKNTDHHALASRALVRARLRQWEAALVDAEKSIEIQSSVVGYIAKYVALMGKGETHKGCRVCDIAFHIHPNYTTLFLLVKAIVLFTVGEHEDAISRMDDLVTLRFFDPTFRVVQAYMHLVLGNLHAENNDYDHAIQSFKHAQVRLGSRTDLPPSIVSLISGWKFDDLSITIQQRLCEVLFLMDRTKQAGECVLQMIDGEISMSESLKAWVFDFLQRCLSIPPNSVNESSVHTMMPLLKEWAKLRLATWPWSDVLVTATGFMLPRFVVFQAICESLEISGRVVDALSCFYRLCSELAQEIDDEQAIWADDFKSRCRGRLEELGDVAMGAKKYDEAIAQYTTVLTLNPASSQNLLEKRSDAYVGKGEWEGALNDAIEVIKFCPSSPSGYERKRAALYGMGCYDGATDAFEAMLSKISESPDPEIRERSRNYVKPEKTKERICTTVKDTICESPLVLINTASGRLCDKSEQAHAFEKTPTFTELVSSVTTHIDDTRIKQQVEGFFRYAMLSHKWEDDEPLFEKVINVMVYDLEALPAHDKLQMFCRIVREAGLHWAWSDTCCINKGDHFVLQEALISMFKWYEGAAMTIIFLRGVHRLALRGALMRSLWNMRAWTLQEYHASKVVRVYTEDWTPYLGLDIYNHKESPEIISEMEEVTGISAGALMALRPGLNDIREKLRLASTRQTTRVEDAAYSLLGIFSISLPVVYGEGDKALGRLLAQLLTSSGDMSVLAWRGKSGSFNSCLPANITVFNHPPISHIPPLISSTEMESITARLRVSSLDLTLATKLYDQLFGLSIPFFVGQRLKFPCLTFKIELLSPSQNGPENVFHVRTPGLGVVKIEANQDLSQFHSLYLVHPWIDFLLDRQPIQDVTSTSTEGSMDDKLSVRLGELPSLAVPSSVTSPTIPTRTPWLLASLGRTLGGWSVPSACAVEKQTCVLQFIARLKRPFGALLLTPTRRNVDEYKRVSAESLIIGQVEELTPVIIEKLIEGVRMLDVL